MKRISTSWPEAGVELLIKLRADGLSAAEIVGELLARHHISVTRSAVIGMAARLKLPRLKASTSTRKPRRARSVTGRNGNPNDLATRIAVRKLDEAEAGELRTMPAPDLSDHDIPVVQRRTLLQLNESLCHWPVGDPQEPGFFFCGGPATDGGPYCPHHTERAHQPTPGRTGRPWIMRAA